MIYFLNIIIVLLFSFLTLSFFPHLSLLGAVPLLPVFFILLLTYFRKGFEPIILAALTGILFDFFSSYPFGFYLFFFMFLAVLVRFMFTEGLKTLSFWYYILLSFIALAVFYLAQIGYLYATAKISLSWISLVPVAYGLAVNGVFTLLIYAFSTWYFEFAKKYEDRLKRR